VGGDQNSEVEKKIDKILKTESREYEDNWYGETKKLTMEDYKKVAICLGTRLLAWILSTLWLHKVNYVWLANGRKKLLLGWKTKAPAVSNIF